MKMMVNMEAMPGMKEKLCSLLQKRAEEDPLFAVSFMKGSKSMEECFRYIMIEVFNAMGEQVREIYKGRSNCVMPAGFSAEWVLEKAIHYFDEDNLVVAKEIDDAKYKPETHKATQNSPEPKPMAPVIPIKPKEPTKFTEDSLFFGMDDIFESEDKEPESEVDQPEEDVEPETDEEDETEE